MLSLVCRSLEFHRPFRRPPLTWERSPLRPVLAADDIHLWRVGLALGAEALGRERSVLAPDELRRAARFRFRTHGIRFAAGRAALRRILSQYLDRTPAALRFGAAPGGKPHLADPTEASPLRFNLAHTAALALIAVTRHREVGVDVERLRRDVQHDALAARYFAADEIAGLRALDPPDRPAAFFGCWTRKEAFLKARGDGLRVPLARFAVAITPGPGPVALSIADNPAEAARWSVVSVDAGPGYAAAIAAAAGPVRLHCWDDRDGTPRD